MPFFGQFYPDSHFRFWSIPLASGALLSNRLVIWLTSQFVERIAVEVWAALMLTPIGLAAISTFLSTVLAIDDDASYYRRLRKNGKKIKQSVPKDKPDVIFVVLLLCQLLQRELGQKRVRMVTHPHRIC